MIKLINFEVGRTVSGLVVLSLFTPVVPAGAAATENANFWAASGSVSAGKFAGSAATLLQRKSKSGFGSPCVFKSPWEWEQAFDNIVTPKAGKPETLKKKKAKKKSVPQWVAGDGYYTHKMKDGSFLFFFGDTFVGKTVRWNGKEATGKVRFIRNTVVRYDPHAKKKKNCFSTFSGSRKNNAGVLHTKRQGAGEWWWPSSSVKRDNGLWVFASEWKIPGGVKGSSGNVFAGKLQGNGLFKVSVNKKGKVKASRKPVRVVSPVKNQKRIVWGASVWRDPASGHVYVFGTEHPSLQMVFGKNVYVARADRKGKFVSDSRKWRYATSKGWVKWGRNLKLAKMIDAADSAGTSTGFSVVSSVRKGRKGQPVIVTKENEFLGSKVVTIRGFGKWLKNPKPRPAKIRWADLFSSPSVSSRKVTYLPLAHPNLKTPRGKMWVTVNNNSLEDKVVQFDVTRYHADWYLVKKP